MAGTDAHILALASQIVTAHVAHNVVGLSAVTGLIRSVYNTLADLSTTMPRGYRGVPQPEVAGHHHDHGHHVHAAVHHTHAEVPPSAGFVHPEYGETVFDDYLICMEDGISMKMLKRHLQTVHGMTPDQYRAKWRLPPDYPMVAPEYAKLRSNLALESGLGLKPQARIGRIGRGGR